MGKQPLPRWKALTRAGILLGLALLMAGFVVRDVRARDFLRTDYVALGLWIAGALLAVGGCVLNYRMFLSLLSGRRAGEGINLALTVVLALGLAGLLCFITSRRFARLDWTGRRTYSLHSKTRNILKGLDQDVTATVLFARADDPLTGRALESTMDVLEEFKSQTGHVTVREINWMLQEDQGRWEGLRQTLGDEDVPPFAVIFTTADGHEVVPLGKIITAAMGQVQFTGEDAFAGALTKLTERRKATIYFLTGHGERPMEVDEPMPTGGEQATLTSGPAYSLSRMVKALRKDNYEVKTLNLAAEPQVPDDCDALVIAGPRTPINEAQMRAIRSYLDERSGRALVMLDPVVVSGGASGLEGLLADYDIQAHTDAVGLTNQSTILGLMQSPDVWVLEDGLADHPITRDLKNYTVHFQYACPLTVGESAQPPQPGGPAGPAPVAEQLLTGQASWGERDYRPDSRRAAEYDAGRDVAPPTVVGAVASPPEPPPMGPMAPPMAQEAPGARLVVIGSSLSFVNRVVEAEPANLYLVLNTVNWMAGKLHMLGIPPRTLEFNDIPVSEGQIAASRYIFIIGLPAVIVALGIGVWLLRRR
ncbi:MAG: hypothetical protein AMK73_00360 [Planctomycetes bacterium SM23_32]|nr:MAG: hypothetical protein AMK73_00360 [Planctomycetes bacterium SM23_32]